ncbi:MAG: hypothetical protein AAFS12_17705 [Cyanobacteria bacterium J06632_19]
MKNIFEGTNTQPKDDGPDGSMLGRMFSQLDDSDDDNDNDKNDKSDSKD